MNKFWKDEKPISHVSGHRVDFSKGYSQSCTTGVFSEHGLVGILEASDYAKLDQVSSFLGSITDGMCRIECKPETTELFTRYVEFRRYVWWESSYSFWTETGFLYLRQITVKLIALEKSVFQAYHISGTGTQKWHHLDHLVVSIWHKGGRQILHGGFYKGLHTIFHIVYAKASTQWGWAKAKTVRRYNEVLLNELFSGRTGKQRAHQIQRKLNTMIQDSEILSRSALRTTLEQLESFLHLLLLETEAEKVRTSWISLLWSGLFRLVG